MMIRPRQVVDHRVCLKTAAILLSLLWFSNVFALETGSLTPLFQLKGTDGKPFSLPTDVAVASDGTIFVVDSGNNRIASFLPDGTPDQIARVNGKPLDLSSPIGLAVAKSGNIYIADSGKHRILVVSPTGKPLKEMLLVAGGRPLRPVDVAVSEVPDPTSSRVYVTENTTHSIRVFNGKGKLLKVYGKRGNNPGDFRYPATVAISPDGVLNAVDVLNSRVQRFLESGERIAQVGTWGVTAGRLFRPKGVAVDAKGNIFVGDSYLEVIQVFSPDSHFKYVLGREGKPYRFTTVTGIAVHEDRLYVAETRANRISVYTLGR